jgi:dGTPase
LCHDGEIHNQVLKPNNDKKFEILEKEIIEKNSNPATNLVPMTMEGCVVRMADTIAYVGRDIEDAIRLNMIKRSELPKETVKILGDTNGTIVFNLVTDIIQNSYQKQYIAFSSKVSNALKHLKNFNLERIYLNPNIKRHLDIIRSLFEMLFEKYLTDIETKNHESVIFHGFLSDMSEDYFERHRKEEIVRDFIAGMTDQYFLRQCPEHLQPKPTVG